MKTDKFIEQILPLKDNLYRMAFRITGDKELSEQIVKEAMMEVWRQRYIWTVIEDLPSYTFMVTRNFALKNGGTGISDLACFSVG